jgi:hypothetical protein
MKVASFATLINQKVLIPSSRTQYVAVDKEHLVDFLKPTLRTIYIDADWYLLNNPDIAEAIRSGIVANAEDHYVTYGYYEHRMPYEIKVEEEWYLTQYPDVKDAVLKGLFGSAHGHYYAVGFREGRLPHANFSLCIVEQ